MNIEQTTIGQATGAARARIAYLSLASRARVAATTARQWAIRHNAALAYLDGRAAVDSRPYSIREYHYIADMRRRSEAIADKLADESMIARLDYDELTLSIQAACNADNRG